MKYIKKKATIGLVTNNFHVYRALQIAKNQKIENIHGIAADSSAFYMPNNMFREYLDSLGLDNEVIVIDRSIDLSVVEAEDAKKIKEQEEMLWPMQALQAGLGQSVEGKRIIKVEER